MHITVAGRLGSGKSTVCRLLKDECGFTVYSTGAVQREIANKMGISTLKLNELMFGNPEYDNLIDDTVARISVERADEKIVFDSRMAWHFAKESFKVYVTVDPTVAAIRVMGDNRGSEEQYSSIEDARKGLIERSMLENKRYKEMYGVDNFDYSNYDLVLDSSSIAPNEVFSIIMREYEAYSKSPSEYKRKVLLSPKSLYPTSTVYDSDAPLCTVVDYFHYILSGHSAVISAARSGAGVVDIAFSSADEKIAADVRAFVEGNCPKAFSAFEKECGFEYPAYPSVAAK